MEVPVVKIHKSSIVAFSVSIALFMHLADTAAMATALPILAEELDSTPLRLKLLLTSYLIVSAIFIPISGWVADRWGARRIYMSTLLLFLLSSLLCAISNSFEQLLLARICQGIAAGIMVPVSRIIVLSCTERADLVRALNWYAIPAIVGPMLGPTIAGLMLEYASWRWIFAINIPIGILGLFLVLLFVPSVKLPDPGNFDFPGALLAALSIVVVMIFADSIGMSVLSDYQLVFLAVTAIFLSLVAIRHFKRVANPMLPLSLFKLSTYRASVVGGGLLIIGMGATTFLLPLMLQTVFGWSALLSGLVLLWGAVGAILGRFVSLILIKRLGFRKHTAIFAGISAITATFPAFYQFNTPAFLIFGLTMLNGILRTTHFAAANALAFAEVDEVDNSGASTLMTVTKLLAQSFGVSFAALMIVVSTDGGSIAISGDAFVLPFLAIGVVALLAVPGYLSLNKDAGSDMQMSDAKDIDRNV